MKADDKELDHELEKNSNPSIKLLKLPHIGFNCESQFCSPSKICIHLSSVCLRIRKGISPKDNRICLFLDRPAARHSFTLVI